MGDTQKSAPPPPDTSRYSDASYALGQDMRDWAQTMWQSGQEEWGRLREWGQNVLGMTMPAMEEMYGWAKDQRDRYEKYAVPAMESLFSDAETYASKEEEQRQRGQAIQDVATATDAEREAHRRNLESYGVDPSETRYAALDTQAGIASAGMKALAANQAGERTKAIGRDLRDRAINVGAGMAQQSLQASGQGTATGVAGMQAATGANVAGYGMTQGAIPYAQGAYGGYGQAAGIVDTSYGRDLQKTELDNAAAQQNWNNWGNIGYGIATMPIPGMAEGGPIEAPGSGMSDSGAIAISDGEYVIPADVVRKLGTNHFDKLIEKETGRPPPAQKQAIPIDPNKNEAMGLAPPVGVLR